MICIVIPKTQCANKLLHYYRELQDSGNAQCAPGSQHIKVMCERDTLDIQV